VIDQNIGIAISQEEKGTNAAAKFPAYLVVLCIERWCLKQNAAVRLKSKYSPPKNFGLAMLLDEKMAQGT